MNGVRSGLDRRFDPWSGSEPRGNSSDSTRAQPLVDSLPGLIAGRAETKIV